jgi:hypothetical protein
MTNCATCDNWRKDGSCEEIENELEFEVDEPYCGVYAVKTPEDFYCNLYKSRR